MIPLTARPTLSSPRLWHRTSSLAFLVVLLILSISLIPPAALAQGPPPSPSGPCTASPILTIQHSNTFASLIGCTGTSYQITIASPSALANLTLVVSDALITSFTVLSGGGLPPASPGDFVNIQFINCDVQSRGTFLSLPSQDASVPATAYSQRNVSLVFVGCRCHVGAAVAANSGGLQADGMWLVNLTLPLQQQQSSELLLSGVNDEDNIVHGGQLLLQALPHNLLGGVPPSSAHPLSVRKNGAAAQGIKDDPPPSPGGPPAPAAPPRGMGAVSGIQLHFMDSTFTVTANDPTVGVNMGLFAVRNVATSNVATASPPSGIHIHVERSSVNCTWAGSTALQADAIGPESYVAVVFIRGGPLLAGGAPTSPVRVELVNVSSTVVGSGTAHIVHLAGTSRATRNAFVDITGGSSAITLLGPRAALAAEGVGVGLKREGAVVACDTCDGLSVIVMNHTASMAMSFSPQSTLLRPDVQNILSEGMLGSLVRLVVANHTNIMITGSTMVFVVPSDAGSPVGLVAILGLNLVSILPASLSPSEPTIENSIIDVERSRMHIQLLQEMTSDNAAPSVGFMCSYSKLIAVQADISLTTTSVGVAMSFTHVFLSAHGANLTISITDTILDVAPALPTFAGCAAPGTAVAKYQGITLPIKLPSANISVVGSMWAGSLDSLLLRLVTAMLVDPLLLAFLPSFPLPTRILVSGLAAAVVLPSAEGAARSAPLSQSTPGWNPRWFLTNTVGSGSVITAALVLTHVRIENTLTLDVATVAGRASSSFAVSANGSSWAVPPPLLTAVDIEVPSRTSIQLHGDAPSTRGTPPSAMNSHDTHYSLTDATAVFTAPFGLVILDRISYSDYSTAYPTCLWTAARSTSATGGRCPTPTTPPFPSQMPLLRVFNISVVIPSIGDSLVTTIAPDATPAPIIINNITAAIQWVFHNVLVAHHQASSSSSLQSPLFAQVQFPASMPGTRVPISPNFVWGSNDFVSVECVAVNYVAIWGGNAADILPSTLASSDGASWDASQLNYLVRTVTPGNGRARCLSFTQKMTITATLTPPNTTADIDPSGNAAALTLKTWADASASMFPIVMLIILCAIPRHFLSAVVMLRIVALARVGDRSLTFLDNPFHIDVGGGSWAAAATLNGSFLSLAVVWAAWSFLSLVTSMIGAGCGAISNHTQRTTDETRDDDDRTTRLIEQSEDDNDHSDDASCSPMRPHPIEVLALLATPTTVMMFPWFMVSTYSLASGGDQLAGGVIGMIIGVIGSVALIWNAFTVKQVSLPFWLVTTQSNPTSSSEARRQGDGGGGNIPTNAAGGSINHDNNSDDGESSQQHQRRHGGHGAATPSRGCWEQHCQSQFELVPSGASDDTSRRSSSTLWLKLLMAHLHPNVHIRVFALQLIGVVCHSILISAATVTTVNTTAAKALFATSAALSALTVIVSFVYKPLGATIDVSCYVILNTIGLISSAMCAADVNSSSGPVVMAMIAGGVSIALVTLTTIAGCLCGGGEHSGEEDDDEDHSRNREGGMYTLFLQESPPSDSNITQNDWDVLKRMLYAKLLDEAGDDERAAVYLQGKDPLTVVLGIICRNPPPRRSSNSAAVQLPIHSSEHAQGDEPAPQHGQDADAQASAESAHVSDPEADEFDDLEPPSDEETEEH